MRRGGPPILPVEPGLVPPVCRVGRGPRGLRFELTGEGNADAAPLRAVAGAPATARRATIVADGALALLQSPGVAFTLALPRMHVVHDRRPPGLDLVVGAPRANAGLLRGEDGWRAVVLPSLGDVLADLGPGPVAIRPDGRRVAVVHDGAVVEQDLGAEAPAGTHPGAPEALAYSADGRLLVAAGGRVGPPGLEPGTGPRTLALATAAAAPRAAALRDDGTIAVWDLDTGAALGTWPSPVPDAGAIALTADGAAVALGTPDAPDPAAGLARVADGALIRLVEGARVIAPAPGGPELLVAGDWGCALLKPPEETE